MLDNQEQIKKETANESAPKKVKGKWGGPRPGSGRPKRMEETEIIERLKPMEIKAFKALERKIDEGDIKAIQIYLNYYIGMPTQRVESKIEGQLNQVSIEVVKPQMQPDEVMAN